MKTEHQGKLYSYEIDTVATATWMWMWKTEDCREWAGWFLKPKDVFMILKKGEGIYKNLVKILRVGGDVGWTNKNYIKNHSFPII